MHKVSRSLLTAGVMALGVIAAACGSDQPITPIPTTTAPGGITNLSVTPPSATIPAGTTISLSALVVADAATAKTVTWSTSSAAIATVDATGKVTGVAAGVASITATATADPSKAAGAVITVTAGPVVADPTISIASVTDLATNNPVNTLNVAGQINVTVNTSGGGLVEVFLSTNCTTNLIGSADVAAASQVTSSAQSGQVTLSINTAALTSANAPRFSNGAYCIKARLTSGTKTVVATNTSALTLNNTNQFRGTTVFAAKNTLPNGTAALLSTTSSVNGLSYTQGELTLTLTPAIFTTSTAAGTVSGYLTRRGTVLGGASPGNATFTATIPAAGTQTVVFTDTATINPAGTAFVGGAGTRSIAGYLSPIEGDTLYITAAVDASGNPIPVTPTPGSAGYVVAGPFRIDNAPPAFPTTTAVTAPNGYIGAGYTFSTGTTGGPGSDSQTIGGNASGVGGVTTTYYVGATSAAGFTTANSCSLTGLAPVATSADLANTSTTETYHAKVVTFDALGNKVCRDVNSTFSGPTAAFNFGVDKIPPTITSTTANTGVTTNTGYNTLPNYSLIYNDTISGFDPTKPFKVSLTRGFFTTGTSDPTAAATLCVIGTGTTANKKCDQVNFNPGTTTNNTVAAGVLVAGTVVPSSPFGTPPNAGTSFEITGGTAVVGYYTMNATPVDRASNSGNTVTTVVAYDNVAPTASAATQSPSPATALGSVTVSSAVTDGLDLASSSGVLSYTANGGAGGSSVTGSFGTVAGTSFGPNFDASTVTSGVAAVTFTGFYRGIQGVDAGNVIQGTIGNPQANITVTDVGTNTASSGNLGLTVSGSGTAVFTAISTTITAAATSPAARAASVNTTVNITSAVTNPAFQSQPLAQVDVYRIVGGVLTNVGSITTPTVTDIGANRTFSYIVPTTLRNATTDTFVAIGRTAAGDAVATQTFTITNP